MLRVTIEIYRSRAPARDWYWRMTTRKGRIIGASSEGYRRVGDLLKNLRQATGIHVQRRLDMFKKPSGLRSVMKDEETHVITGRIQAPLTFKHTFLWR